MRHDEQAPHATKPTNRLIHETSPYLLQHAHNPVDWYPWGPEALAKAQAEDKPIFLSVGYSACHWCHVMEQESFENTETARLMNQRFVSIKVDREERPDIDALYMDAVQAMTGSGGWPMSVFLTPDGAPFYGGTYFPPTERYGMPSFRTLLSNLANYYQTRRAEVEEQADEFRKFYQRQSDAQLKLPEGLGVADLSHTTIEPDVLLQAADRLLATMDAVEGGFGKAPKFPHPMGLEFLLRIQARGQAPHSSAAPHTITADPRLLPLVTLALDKMAAGGVYDQLGGGFHRYSTDAIWLVPHFEKMLYDNALLASVYLYAWQLTGEQRYRRICEETLDYILREMRDPTSGAFYSTQDADSEGEEGKFYIWSADELRHLLGADDATLAGRYWGVSERGNFEGRNILHEARSLAQVAREFNVSEEHVRAALDRARPLLYQARAQRIWPARDDKALTAWNGFLLRALAEAGRALQRDDYLAAARVNAAFLVETMGADGRLRRSWRNGQARIDAYLEDYASLTNGLLALYTATGEPRWFTEARRWADLLLERFWDDERSVFFDTAHDHESLIGRPRELTDNATPSGTSLAVETLVRLAAYTSDDHYRAIAARMLVALAPAMADTPSAFGRMLCALDDFIGPFYEIAIIGPRDDANTQALSQALAARYLPRSIVALAAPDDTAAQAAVPLLVDRRLVNGQPAAYVCQGFVCQRPVTQPDELLAALR